MSSDVYIVPSVDTSEIEAAIALLDEALGKSARLNIEAQQHPTREADDEEIYIYPRSELKEPYMQAPGFSDFWGRLDGEISGAKTRVDAAVEDGMSKLADLESEAKSASASAEDVLSQVPEIKGTEAAASRIVRMIPGLREAYRLKRSIGQISEGNIVGALGLLMLAYSIYRTVSAMMEEQKRQRQEYQQNVMTAQNFTLTSQFQNWERQQRQALENYRNGVIP